MTEFEIAMRLGFAILLCAVMFVGTIFLAVWLWEMSPLIVLSLTGIYLLLRKVEKS